MLQSQAQTKIEAMKILRRLCEPSGQQYYESLPLFLTLIRNCGFFFFLFDSVAIQIGELSFNYTIYSQQWLPPFISSMVFLFGLLVLSFVSWRLRQPKAVTNKFLKCISWMLDLFVMAIGQFVLIYSTINPRPEITDSGTTFNGWMIGLRTTLFSFGIFNWLPKAAFFIITLFYLVIKTGELSEIEGKLRIYEASTSIVFIIVAVFLMQKYFRTTLAKKANLANQSEIWQKLLKSCSESVLVLDKIGNRIFQNRNLCDVDFAESTAATNGAKINMQSSQDLSMFRKLKIIDIHEDIRTILFNHHIWLGDVKSSTDLVIFSSSLTEIVILFHQLGFF